MVVYINHSESWVVYGVVFPTWNANCHDDGQVASSSYCIQPGLGAPKVSLSPTLKTEPGTGTTRICFASWHNIHWLLAFPIPNCHQFTFPHLNCIYIYIIIYIHIWIYIYIILYYIHIWVCVKTPGPRWICGSLLFNRVLNGRYWTGG